MIILKFCCYSSDTLIMKGYSAFNLTESARKELLNKFPAKFEKTVAHHITYKYMPEDQTIPDVHSVRVVGYACGDNIECVVVEVDGSTQRPDGKVFHITLSHNKETKAVESNLLLEQGWEAVPSFNLEVAPKFNKL